MSRIMRSVPARRAPCDSRPRQRTKIKRYARSFMIPKQITAHTARVHVPKGAAGAGGFILIARSHGSPSRRCAPCAAPPLGSPSARPAPLVSPPHPPCFCGTWQAVPAGAKRAQSCDGAGEASAGVGCAPYPGFCSRILRRMGQVVGQRSGSINHAWRFSYLPIV